MGLIYFLEKKDNITIVKEKKPSKAKLNKFTSIKDYFFPAIVEPDTFTKKEWDEKWEEHREETERLFRR